MNVYIRAKCLPDREAQKRNLVVQLGLPPSRWSYLFLMTFPFLFLFFLLGSQGISYPVLISFLALPLAIKAIRIFWDNYEAFEQIIPAKVLTIQTHMTLGIFMLVDILIGQFSVRA